MLTGISFATVAMVVVVAFIFRSSLKKASAEMPKVVDTALGTMVKATTALDSVVTTNIIENDVELQQRIAKVEAQIELLGGIKDINALYRRLHS